MSTKTPINISITGESDEQKQLLAILLAEFLEFSGFEVAATFSHEPSDAELIGIFDEFEASLAKCVETASITISE